ncbi:MAG TPA: type II toxin-antitoxin system VapC family toxin [Devosiaceae bacterium]|jgi:predicted nucleic-acid-binding protein|nr:type II toxin-antitoxin system VapC family toxin [Devosiaceae bacterium]
MIGVDTNVLVRLFVGETSRETKAALDFLAQRSGEDPAFVSVVVLVEFAWVLKRVYGRSPAEVLAALDNLLESANVEVERAELVESALGVAQAEGADIADCIIAALATDAGATKTMTFDKPAAKRIPGMELLA